MGVLYIRAVWYYHIDVYRCIGVSISKNRNGFGVRFFGIDETNDKILKNASEHTNVVYYKGTPRIMALFCKWSRLRNKKSLRVYGVWVSDESQTLQRIIYNCLRKKVTIIIE